ncbi:D-2-hydroxyacid dehydrogenase [Streptomyces alkaliphilus]|uniref:D-2-hydroxyacid dehydrogenase n=1 Tax=Streptomyces alkaliphilus TaxID=1472722 RepID=A0A7W3TIL1_9ACTN|nr:D-2-hydroxyacid dehydrogenase [Streptomyces alkaliphilus]MBB0247155.1 D-2-hydroxyacid dehydrogenase [Streptomyces alkaliphilus]
MSTSPRLDRLAGRADITRVEAAELAGALPGADVLLVWDFTSDAVRRCWPGPGPRPGWVHTASAGVDRLLFPELVESDTVVTNARGVFDGPIAEYVAGLVLAVAKDLPGTWRRQREHRWEHRETRRVAGTRAVVVGSGPIGRRIARVLGALEVHAEVVGRRGREDDPEVGRIHAADTLPDLLPGADWVICAAPLTDATRGMFDAAAFARMRPGSCFVNIGRGGHVVEEDLIAALRSGRPAAAALDVFAKEPLPPDSPLWDAPGLLVSPHMSGDTLGWHEDLADRFQDAFELWVAGGTPPNTVDKRLGYPSGS